MPTVGSMQGGYVSFMLCSKLEKGKDTTLFIDPGFPVQKLQHKILNVPYETFEIYNFRGQKLKDKLRSIFDTGKISSILYSNPNNPTWICLTEQELESIGVLCKEYNVIPIEDLAYFGLDYRENFSIPGEPPYQPSVANYCDEYIILLSSSKIFSYAGQRIATLIFSNKLFNKHVENFIPHFATDNFGNAAIYGCLYALSAGASHSSQYGLAAMLKAANDGELNFVELTREYEVRARKLKHIFLKNGFNIVYDKDGEEEIGDGFYFTISYPGMTSSELIEELLYYGISAISLEITGSEKTEGIRACVSQIKLDSIPELEKRIELFHKNHL
jgi:aspartate/methionine/tyrosine aminotransferase